MGGVKKKGDGFNRTVRQDCELGLMERKERVGMFTACMDQRCG